MASQSPTGPKLICLGITNSDVRDAFGGELAVVGTQVPGVVQWSVCGPLGAI